MRFIINNIKLKGNTKNIRQATIVDLDNSNIITILKFNYNILERSNLILNLIILYKELNIAKELKSIILGLLIDFKLLYYIIE
jgi:hypothetical protein